MIMASRARSAGVRNPSTLPMVTVSAMWITGQSSSRSGFRLTSSRPEQWFSQLMTGSWPAREDRSHKASSSAVSGSSSAPAGTGWPREAAVSRVSAWQDACCPAANASPILVAATWAQARARAGAGDS